ncbi:MAG: hypothetical protein CMH83_07915 [Nocardioides sp.]|nr:hypothetical protein [Nocardioides sp.]
MLHPTRLSARPSARLLRPVALALALLAVPVLLVAALAGPGAAGGDRPVIVSVGGDAANGFDLRYADGSSLHPPTSSEALAECSAYDGRLDRVKCRVRFRTWYRDLGDLQRSLAWHARH